MADRVSPGFTLLEFLAFLLLTTAGLFLFYPPVLEERISVNEESAIGFLRMQSQAEMAWKERTGRWASLMEMTWTSPVPPSGVRGEGPLPPLLPGGIPVDSEGGLMRSGYYFRQAGKEDRSGCWAWPKESKYSGSRIFWLDHARGKVFPVRKDALARDPGHRLTPPPDSLGPEILP